MRKSGAPAREIKGSSKTALDNIDDVSLLIVVNSTIRYFRGGGIVHMLTSVVGVTDAVKLKPSLVFSNHGKFKATNSAVKPNQDQVNHTMVNKCL